MDHFDVTTGVLDSWDLLNCPVLETYIDRNKKQANNLTQLASSTSLFLKETTYTPEFNSISAGYYPACCDTIQNCHPAYDKPIIQVTVIPRSTQATANANKRRKQPIKKITLPNPDHSDSTKNIYLLLPGRKKDKVYAIDTTNAKIFKEINDNTLLSECIMKSYFKDMNRNKKKAHEKVKAKGIPECSPGCAYMNILNKTKNLSPERSGAISPRSPVRTTYEKISSIEANKSSNSDYRRTEGNKAKSPEIVSLNKDSVKTKSPIPSSEQKTKINIYKTDKSSRKEGAIKSPDRFSYACDKRSIESIIAETKRKSPERFDPNSSRPGRIRITGRLGLTEDNKCVLKCNATLDDKPIATQLQGAACAMLPQCFQACNEVCGSSKKQRDANVQARESTTDVRFHSRATIGKESQATQVDFQLLYPTTKIQREQCGRGQIMQKCACVNTIKNYIDTPINKDETSTALKKNNSPIIVISVFSKNEVSNASSSEVKQKEIVITGQKKDNKKNGRSRSPSPAKGSRKVGGKKSDNRINTLSSKKTVRETARKETRSKVIQSPSRTGYRSTTVTKRTETTTNKTKSPKPQKTPPQSNRTKSPQIDPEEVSASEKMKRALIDNFTKTYTEQIAQRNVQLDIPLQTKHNVSNITIEIEGDSDYYNVKFEQDVGKLNTELTVRKPIRGKRTGELATGENDTTSLENFLYIQPEDGPRKRSFSQTLMYDGTDQTMNSEIANENELNVRDSIELSHRREHRASLDDDRERNDVPKEVGTKGLATHNKHFQGDKCSIPDPGVRDKEIRRLLEIDKGIKRAPVKFRTSKTANVLGTSSQSHVHNIYDTFRNIQAKNSTITAKDLDKNEFKDLLYDTVNLNLPLYQLIWNHNVQLLFKLQWRKPKPIVLTRHQYAKVKRTIYNTLIQKHNNLLRTKVYNHNRRLCTYDIVRHETKNIILHYDRQSQTEDVIDASKIQAHGLSTMGRLLTMRSDIDTCTINEITNCGDASSIYSKDKSKFSVDSSHETFEHSSNANWTEHAIKFNKYMHNIQRTVLIARDRNRPNSDRFKEEFRRKSSSVKEIQYKRVAITKQRVKFSSSDTAEYYSTGPKIEQNDSYSIHTIFKSHQKSITPNLGTSANSFCNASSERLDSKLKFFEDSFNHKMKPKKPFLWRLISCLAFKVSPASEPKIPEAPFQTRSPNSSFDSYHISTSLGAIEMSSSLYDTTASFYSDHTIPRPVKKKQGFFSSVRGFLTRKS